jgi:hypothetical protein
MTTLITGSFQQQSSAAEAVAALVSAGFAIDQTTSFFLSPAGQHDLTGIGGDADASPGMERAGGDAFAGATAGGAAGMVAGLATVPLLGPAALVVGAGVGAYVGSLYGALDGMHEDPEAKTPHAGSPVRQGASHRKSGMQVAVAAPGEAEQESAIRILRAHGATDIEHPSGHIVDGDWTDFDPLAPWALVEP